ncbi:MAG: YhcH/YjgK/YiaL family protein [Treponema sp.]|jgi:YhcH/YjgK/YiaL family protein|nr:YhcH/YjgK/YiaL family protein [Treponema sp.]
MIISTYNHLILPSDRMNSNWETALAWLAEERWKNIPPGRTEIAGQDVYATLSAYTTKLPEEAPYETHRRYADIQLVLEGTEIIMIADTRELETAEAYNAEKDYELYRGDPASSHWLVLSWPAAAIVFPGEAHRPAVALNRKPSPVKKIVVKVRLD